MSTHIGSSSKRKIHRPHKDSAMCRLTTGSLRHPAADHGQKSRMFDKRTGSDIDALAPVLRNEIPSGKSGRPLTQDEVSALHFWGWHYVTSDYVVVRVNVIISSIGILRRPLHNGKDYEDANIFVRLE